MLLHSGCSTLASLMLSIPIICALTCDQNIDFIMGGANTPSLALQELGQIFAAKRQAETIVDMDHR